MLSPICVIIPVYNAGGRLAGILKSLMELPYPIWVVNDGSTDNILEELSEFEEKIHLISYHPNRGKAYALQKGFKDAMEKGCRYAITMDADGQHQVKDIQYFVEKINQHEDALLIGVRDFSHPNMPKGNRFANRFSNFWFTLQTAIRLEDTQTGFRLYPLRKINKINLLTRRYDGELELLVRSAWRGIEILSIPIDVIYPPEGERITHFHPRNDFLRITLLNTILCIIALLYGLPVRAGRMLLKRRTEQGKRSRERCWE